MSTGVWRVRVYWTSDVSDRHPLPGVDRRRVAAIGPGTPATTAVVHRAAVGERHPGGPGFADEHLLADADAPGPWPSVADVLVSGGPLGRAAALRARCPGCLVVAFRRPDGEHLLEVAMGWLARAAPLAGEASVLWPYAAFVHAWTIAGRPLDALDGASLQDGRAGVRISVVGRPAARPAAS